MLRKYLEKSYVQSLLIAVISTLVFKLFHKKNKDENKSNVNFVELFKVFVSTAVSAQFILFSLNFKFGEVGGGGKNNLNFEIHDIMTGKPSF